MSRQLHALTQKDAQTYLRIGITPVEVVRLRWPDITDEDADYVLWEMTAYPMRGGLQDIADMIADLRREPPRTYRRSGQAVTVA